MEVLVDYRTTYAHEMIMDVGLYAKRKTGKCFKAVFTYSKKKSKRNELFQ